MPPLEVSYRQIIVGPNYPDRIEGGRVRSLKTAHGRYDLGALVSSLPADQKPELTLVLADAFQQCLPENLAAVPGRKVLLAADTHHGQNPLQKLLAYTRQESFDRIAVIHDPHHFLVTDRLSPQSGLDVLFRRGKDYVDYDGPDDLIAKLKHYLGRPGECLKIARCGQASYLKDHSPAQRIRDLLDFAVGNAARSFTADRRARPGQDEFGRNLVERARLYEVMQSFAQHVEKISVVVDSAVGARCISDLVDLPRLKIDVAVTAGQGSSLKESLVGLGVLGQINLFEGGGPRPCDVLVIDGDTLTAAGDAQSLRTRFLLVRDGGDGMVAGKVSWLTAHGFKKLAEMPWVFERVQ